MDNKYISVEADNYAGNYCTEVSKISDEQVDLIKVIVEKLKTFRSTQKYDYGIKYATGEMMDAHNRTNPKYSSDWYLQEGILNNIETNVLCNFLPSGDENYRGIHTIVNIQIFEHIEDVLI